MMQPEPPRLAPPRIGGILIYVAFGLIVGFIQNLAILGASTVPLRSPTWEHLTTPAFSTYHPYWKSALIFEVISNSLTLLVNAIALVLFFRKHRTFPTLMVVTIPLLFAVMLVRHFLDGLVPAVAASQAYGNETHTVIIKFIALHVWVPYFLFSKRVKRTFVR